MTEKRYLALETEIARHYQSGGADANGQVPERKVSEGGSMPCRHCLQNIAAGEEYLVFAHRPFPAAQPYAEIGPIFLHAGACSRYEAFSELPAMFRDWETIMLRGYGADDRIVYGTGTVVDVSEIAATADDILRHPDVRYVHARSARNNCYQCRIEPVG
ncbi:DUF1203 domain-containing protein [Nisaea acidiphila]|uniref:DUF1203 domain-containing protein n=1 Tax=Nisaea acidiphila TaxID=1862145 RepID=A0A9J7AS15_9PROT|nr:DUF1203 domain-containing protein [Nisaea acidiphila]UUX50144.1 DUF1203 domain-containing protein [Nisaea acidiphila]